MKNYIFGVITGLSIVASMAYAAVMSGEVGSLTGFKSIGVMQKDYTVNVGESQIVPDLEIPVGRTYTNDGKLYITGVLAGGGVLAGSGTVTNID